MHFVGLLVLVILACLFFSSIQGCGPGGWPVGAMCYSVVPVPPTAEYTCSACGQKTLYDKDEAAWVVEDMATYRREFDLLVQVSPIQMKLDESSFCAKCSPNATEHQLVLTVTHEDGTTNTTKPVSIHDLIILKEYFQGRLVDYTPYKTDSLIQQSILRIKQLLGREIPVPQQKQ